MITLPPPLVPADLDLRRLWWMKLDIGSLINSEFNTLTCDDTAWRAGVTLWLKAWHQVPAGSLPNDDAALCHLAGLGRDVKGWKKIRVDALRGFTLCSDGRLYHGFLCKMAIEAYDEIMRFETRLQRDRERKAKSSGIPAEATALSDGIPAETHRNRAKIPAEIPGHYTTRQESNPPNPPRQGGTGNQRSVEKPSRHRRNQSPVVQFGDAVESQWRNRLASGPDGLWLSGWGPRPNEADCEAPAALIGESPWASQASAAA